MKKTTLVKQLRDNQVIGYWSTKTRDLDTREKRMKTATKFNSSWNLDDEMECETFIETYGTTRGMRLAHKLGFTGTNARRAANALSNYAWNKHTAVNCRRKGDITTALQYEAICDRIYSQDIQPIIDCW